MWHRPNGETVSGRLRDTVGLMRERPHTLAGFQARLVATVARHHLRCRLPRRQERPLLAVADLLAW